jgi:quercetin dioxygenase-like cupin family protein
VELAMPPDVQHVPRPNWHPHAHPGCSGVDLKVLLHLDHLVLAMLRFRPGASIHEHAAPHDADVICLEGRGFTSLDGQPAALNAGQRIRWPASVPHRLWTEDGEMVTLMVEHHPVTS